MAILNGSSNAEELSTDYAPTSVVDEHVGVFKALRDDTTDNDRRAVRELRVKLRSMHLLPSEQDDFFTLLRFLRASNLDDNKAAERWASYMDWWRENDGSNLHDFQFPEFDKFKEAFPSTLHGIDRQGRPVLYERLGRAKFSELTKISTMDRILRFKAQEFVTNVDIVFPAASVAAGRHIWQRTQVFDVAGLSFRSLSLDAMAFFKGMGKLDSEVFPQTCHTIIIINASTIFRSLFSTVKHIFNADTVSRVHVLGTDYHKELLKFIDPSEMPSELGGTCNCEGGCFSAGKGPWKDGYTLEAVQQMRRGSPQPQPDSAPSSENSDLLVQSPTHDSSGNRCHGCQGLVNDHTNNGVGCCQHGSNRISVPASVCDCGGISSDDDDDEIDRSSFGAESPVSVGSFPRGVGEEVKGEGDDLEACFQRSGSSHFLPLSFSDWNAKEGGASSERTTILKQPATAVVDLDAGWSLTRGSSSVEEDGMIGGTLRAAGAPADTSAAVSQSAAAPAMGVEERLEMVEREVGGLNEILRNVAAMQCDLQATVESLHHHRVQQRKKQGIKCCSWMQQLKGRSKQEQPHAINQ